MEPASTKPAMPMLKKIGLYCAVKAVDKKTDIIDLTQKAFGLENISGTSGFCNVFNIAQIINSLSVYCFHV
jgi:hypothetical protein